jgi:hypothetical protein
MIISPGDGSILSSLDSSFQGWARKQKEFGLQSLGWAKEREGARAGEDALEMRASATVYGDGGSI